MNPLRAAFVTLLIVVVAAAAATAAGYGPFVDLLRPGAKQPAANADTVRTQLAASATALPETSAPKSTPSCKFCGKPCLSCPAPPADEDISVELALAAAEYNEHPKADLSKLKFEVAASWPGYSGEHQIEVDSAREIPRQKLELGLCTLEVEPLIGAARVTAGRATSQREWTTQGAYRLTLRDDAGKLMDQRILGPSDADTAKPKDYTTLDTSRGVHADSRRDIFEGQVKEFRSAKPLFSYEVMDGVNDKQTAVDPAGNRFAYVFPRVKLKMYPRELLEARRAERLAQRQVRYGWHSSKKAGDEGGGERWGYMDLPSLGGGAGGCGG